MRCPAARLHPFQVSDSDIHDTLLYAPGNAIYPDSLDSGRSQHVHALAQQAFKVLGELNESKAYGTFEFYDDVNITRPLRRKSFGSYQLLTSPPNVGKNGQKRYFRPHLGGTSVLTVPQNPQRISAVVY